MSKRNKTHKIEVKRRPGSEGTIQTGATTQIFLDGKLIGGAYSFKFEVEAKKVARCTIELFAEVDLEIDTPLYPPNVKESKYIVNGKPVAIHTLSNYAPRVMAYKRK